MTTMIELDDVSAAPAPPRRRWRRWLLWSFVAVIASVLAAWRVVGAHPAVERGAFGAWLDAKPIGDGLETTRYLLPTTPGDYSVLTSVRNAGRFAFTLDGIDTTRTLDGISVTFEEDANAPGKTMGDASLATRTSVTVQPGQLAGVLVTFHRDAESPPIAAGGSMSFTTVPLRVTQLGVTSVQDVQLLQAPIVVTDAGTMATLLRDHAAG
ncbi:MAG: hypothetical protein JWM93_2243 [Frankiales bacterium]|nr:hypothetical protein [Frankiales bacterium]